MRVKPYILPVALTALAAGALAVWRFVPAARGPMRAFLTDTLPAVWDRVLHGNGTPLTAEEKARERAEIAAEEARFAAAAARPSNPDYVPDEAILPADPDNLPTARGIRRTDPRHAAWGVVRRTAAVNSLDGDSAGTVVGGRLFVIDTLLDSTNGLRCVGNLTPNRRPYMLTIPAADLVCFTGSPDALTDAERTCLRLYYHKTSALTPERREALRRALPTLAD